MEGHRQLDAAGCSWGKLSLISVRTFRWSPRWAWRTALFLLTLLCDLQVLAAQAELSVRAEQAARLVAQREWQAAADLLGPLRDRTADEEYDYGTALARLGRWTDAQRAFDAGAKMAPRPASAPLKVRSTTGFSARYTGPSCLSMIGRISSVQVSGS